MATPYDAPIPGASGYATAALQAKTAYQNALARINAKRTSTLRQYGYLGDIDPTTGVVNNVRVDPYNQYGGLQTMLRNNAIEQQDAEYMAEEKGLHGGLAHKLAAQARYNLGGESAQLGGNFAGALGGYQDEQNQAAYDRDRALYEAELQAARDAIANGDFNPADFSDVNYGGDGDSGANPSGAPAVSGTTRTFVLGGGGIGRPRMPDEDRETVTVTTDGTRPATAPKRPPAPAAVKTLIHKATTKPVIVKGKPVTPFVTKLKKPKKGG